MKPKLFVIYLLWLSGQLFGSLRPETLSRRLGELSLADKDRVLDIADELRCPTCQGLSVLESDVPFSLQIRNAVIQQVKEGRSKDEIMQFFSDRYGAWIRRQPPKAGFHWSIWLLPWLGLLLGGLVLLRFFRSGVTGSGESLARRSEDEILRELDERLAALRGVKNGGER